jgi:hypothetical protein
VHVRIEGFQDGDYGECRLLGRTLGSSGTLVLKRATRLRIQENDILHGYHNLEVVPFRAYAQLPTLTAILKWILEVVSCESVQHRLQFCLDHLGFINVAVSSTGGTEKTRKGAVQASTVG